MYLLYLNTVLYMMVGILAIERRLSFLRILLRNGNSTVGSVKEDLDSCEMESVLRTLDLL